MSHVLKNNQKLNVFIRVIKDFMIQGGDFVKVCIFIFNHMTNSYFLIMFLIPYELKFFKISYPYCFDLLKFGIIEELDEIIILEKFGLPIQSHSQDNQILNISFKAGLHGN